MVVIHIAAQQIDSSEPATLARWSLALGRSTKATMILLNHRWKGNDLDKERLCENLEKLYQLLVQSNDSAWSNESASKVAENVKCIYSDLKAGKRIDISRFLIQKLPTGPIDDIAIDNGWGDEWIEISKVLDECLSDNNLSVIWNPSPKMIKASITHWKYQPNKRMHPRPWHKVYCYDANPQKLYVMVRLILGVGH